MRITDLTHTIKPDMDVYPGVTRPVIQWLSTLTQDGHASSRIAYDSHTGTHVDAPKHFARGGKSLTEIHPSSFAGSAVMLKVKEGSDIIELEDLKQLNKDLKDTILVLNTGVHHKYGTPTFFQYPTLTREAAQWLVETGVKAIATDASSLDPVADSERCIHHIILEANIPVIEALANLDDITEREFFLVALPLKIAEGDGSPCRAIAIENPEF